jgi:pyridoxamine 5'-phosphate oxidase family protein
MVQFLIIGDVFTYRPATDVDFEQSAGLSVTRDSSGKRECDKEAVMAQSVFTEQELAYLHGERRLARIATVGRDGTPHVVPSGFVHNLELDTIDLGGRDLEQTKKWRDVTRTGRAAVVIDDLASVNPWRPRAIEVRGWAEAIPAPETLIRIHPERIVSWGLGVGRSARTVSRSQDD